MFDYNDDSIQGKNAKNYNDEQENQFLNEEELNLILNNKEVKKNNIYELYIRNDIALNLQMSLYLLQMEANLKGLKNSFCQIKVTPFNKLMIIYLEVNNYYIRIKTELQKVNLNKISISSQQSNNENIENESNINNYEENDFIFSFQFMELYNIIELLLCDNKDFPLIFFIDKEGGEINVKVEFIDIDNQIFFKKIFHTRLTNDDKFFYPLMIINNQKIIKKRKYQKRAIIIMTIKIIIMKKILIVLMKK